MKTDRTTSMRPPESLRYRLARHLNAAVRQLRDAEDMARMEMPGLPTADRIRSIYEQITADLLNGKTNVPRLVERVQGAEERCSRLAVALLERGVTNDELNRLWES